MHPDHKPADGAPGSVEGLRHVGRCHGAFGSFHQVNDFLPLFAGHGVAELRVISVGLGETEPRVPNDTEQGRQANRRVELRIEPIRG